VSGALTIGYTDGTTTQAPLTVADWCAPAAPGSTAVLTMAHRIKAGQGVDTPRHQPLRRHVPSRRASRSDR